ncbi:MAG: DUF4395 domain-containing protein [Intrasporangiaceae bacterium]|nr:DUF4395 domain-containing protein [Intrasporangiaceae bacterium]
MSAPIIGFPSVVNEKAARVVAGFVAALGVLVLVTGWHWVTALMAAGFLLRVLGGPRYSPIGRVAAQVIAPRLGRVVPTAGPPKRFAQAIGLGFTGVAAVAALAFGATGLASVLIGVLVVCALLEAAVGWCAGCFVFAQLMRWGLIPEETCEACNNLALARQ